MILSQDDVKKLSFNLVVMGQVVYTGGSCGTHYCQCERSPTLHTDEGDDVNTRDARETGHKGGDAPLPPDDAERRLWFAPFGHRGDLDEEVTLRTLDGLPLGTATIADVWEVWKGLHTLERDYPQLYRRLLLAAAEDNAPFDRPRILALSEHGCITDETSGEFRPGRRLIVLALVDIDVDAATGTMAAEPLVRQETPEAA